MTKFQWSMLTAALMSTGATGAFAIDLPVNPKTLEARPWSDKGMKLGKSFTAEEGVNFEGIIALNNCSGSLVRFDQTLDSDDALVLTNGHCMNELGRFLNRGEVLTNFQTRREIKILNKASKVIGSVRAKEIVYGTMSGTDAGIYRLTKTYAEIASEFGVKALLMAREAPRDDLSIEVISGYWKRGYRCAVSGTVATMQESNWTWFDSIRYTKPGCETIGGTSGSPILEADTRTVVGVNNTSNESGERCTLNNPCEIDAAGNVTVTRGTSYGQQTYWFTTCLNADRQIDLKVEGCKLPKPAASVVPAEAVQN